MISHTLLPTSVSTAASPSGITTLLESGQVPGIDQQQETINDLVSGSQPQTSPLVSALAKTFGQLGLALNYPGSTTDASSSDASADAKINSAFAQFVGQIFQTLASSQQGVEPSSTSQDGSGNSVSGVSSPSYLKSLTQQLESLAQAVGTSSSQSGSASANGEATSSSDTGLASLGHEFSNLFGSSGTGGTSLQTFLQTLASNLSQQTGSISGGVFVQMSA